MREMGRNKFWRESSHVLERQFEGEESRDESRFPVRELSIHLHQTAFAMEKSTVLSMGTTSPLSHCGTYDEGVF